MSRILLDENDTWDLLRVLYNGKPPARVHTLICMCGAMADLRESPKAWNGWQILPHAKCPACLATTKAAEIAELYPSHAFQRFIQELQDRCEEREGVR